MSWFDIDFWQNFTAKLATSKIVAKNCPVLCHLRTQRGTPVVTEPLDASAYYGDELLLDSSYYPTSIRRYNDGW